MSKKLLYLLVTLFSVLSFSQDIEPFNTLKVYDGLSVTLIASQENKIEISGEEAENVVYESNRGTLKIRKKINKLFSGYKTFVKVYYSVNLEVIQANDDTYIKIDQEKPIYRILLEAYKNAVIEAKLSTEQLLVKAFFNGEVKAVGSAHNQDVSINTGGTYSGENFKTTFTTVAVNAGGNASVNASDYVGANVKAGGTVLIYGNPKKVDEKKLFGGFIKKMNN